MSPSTFREYLVGVLALQLGFVGRERLRAAVHDWRGSRAAGLVDALVRHGDLGHDAASLLGELAARHLKLHADRADDGLASLGACGPLRDELRSLAGEDVEPTLTHTATPDGSPGPTSRNIRRAAPLPAGRYRVVRPHAQGGLGKVSVALDSELNREVALKEIQDRFADDEVSRLRFVLEAEITGGLEHPGIVPVYGLGTDASGRPYYAMRFIRGDSLAETIEQFHGNSEGGTRNSERKTQALPSASESSHSDFRVPTSAFSSVSFRQLLGRFIDVCQAVEYAHSRGVLHRDLKPGNVMLGKYGETLVVDWGLAKPVGQSGASSGETALRPSGGDSTSTRMGCAVGTPAYMPPEQAAGQLDQLGPASDVYSLGATLYHLLTGSAPFQPAPLGRGAGSEGQGAEPRLGLVDLLQRVQAGDFTRPRDIIKSIPKSLEAVCLKAMATQPANRYASPAELADDVERYLADEPVRAGTEPFLLRARRWLRKHPRIVASAAATVLVGLAGLAAVLTVVSLKNDQLSLANQDLRAANVSEREAKNAAVAKQKESDAVFGFFEKYVLAAARPENQAGGLGVNATIREANDAAEPWIAESFADQPLVEASIRHSLGGTYIYLGELDAALRQRLRTHELRETHLGPDHQQTLQSLSSLAAAYHALGELERAESLYEQALELQTATLGQSHLDTLKTMSNRAALHFSAGNPEQAIQLYDETVALLKEHVGEKDPHTLLAMHNLAQACSALGKHDRALPLLQETIELQTAELGAEHPETLYSLVSLAAANQFAGQHELAVPLFEQALAGQRAKLRPEHPHTTQTMERLGNAYLRAEEFEKAEATLGELLSIRRARRPDDFKTFEAMLQLAEVLARRQRHAEAEPLLIEAYHGLVARRAALSPPERERITIAVHRFVNLYEVWEKPAEAERWRKELGVLAPTREPIDAP